MGSRYHRGAIFQKPENALKRADELIVVGQRGAALQTLHDVITSKRHRTWHKVLFAASLAMYRSPAGAASRVVRASSTAIHRVAPDRPTLLLQVLEQIMFRYVDLCVELKKGRYAKDGLIHYRNVCQQVNVSSLEEVIKYFLKTATNKAEAAQSKAAEVSSSYTG